MIVLLPGVNMGNTENQRLFKERMYAAGYKQAIVWVARDPEEGDERISRSIFLKRLDKLTEGWNVEILSKLYGFILSIVKTKTEVGTIKKAGR
jgi:hypothetical protein